ncbi:MAG: hypothetical protein KC561_21960, partial [Myxococcales bacterium]|nr:hypothetical protein [Myxococcales bacterium]
ETDPLNKETYARLDRLLTANGDYSALTHLIDTAITAATGNPMGGDTGITFDLEALYARRARLLMEHLKRPAQAAESLLEAIRLNPAEPEHLQILESQLSQVAPPALLLEAYELHAQALDPKSHDFVNVLRAKANVYERIPGRHREALDHYSQVLTLAPTDDVAFEKLR